MCISIDNFPGARAKSNLYHHPKCGTIIWGYMNLEWKKTESFFFFFNLKYNCIRKLIIDKLKAFFFKKLNYFNW